VAAISILLVDDDVDLCSLMADFFAEQGIRLESVHDGRAGLARALDGGFDLILLDVMLPALDGFQVLEQIRVRSAVPVILLTARIEEHDRVAGLNRGADDYLPKPFGPEELIARIRAVLRRAGKPQGAPAAPMECGGIHLNPLTREVRCGDRPVNLTSIEFDILHHLMKAAGRVVSRDEITTVLYQRQSTPFERALDVHISHLRRKLAPQGDQLLRTIRGVGYQLTAQE